MKIEQKYIQQMRDKGLYVNEYYPEDHVMSDGLLIGKPISTPGNSIAGYVDELIIDIESGEREVDLDTPMLVLYRVGDSFVVWLQQCCPTLGPGDFINEWATAEEAVADVIEFYLGDSRRMAVKAEYHQRMMRRLAD